MCSYYSLYLIVAALLGVAALIFFFNDTLTTL